jgi:cystathionine gamma-synthase
MRIQQESCGAIADMLAADQRVERVHYPGLASHPGHEIAARQQDGFGAMLSFELKGGEAAANAFAAGLTCFTLAESLGAVESLIAHPVSMSHAALSEDERLRAGIGPGLLRLSVGIEDLADLSADIMAGLQRAERRAREPVCEPGRLRD